MSRFVYLSDSHIGADPIAYHQQTSYLDQLPDVLSALDDLISEEGSIDCVIHGGDIINQTGSAEILAAKELLSLSVPVVLCLGNHDLTAPDSWQQWIDGAPQFFPDGTPHSHVELDDCIIHVMPNHWHTTPYFWDPAEQTPHFTQDQLDILYDGLSRDTQKPHILSTHCQATAVPTEQTGMDDPYHGPAPEFEKTISDLCAKHPHIECVLGAHSHINLHVERNGVNLVTSSALSEAPFDIKVFDVTPEAIRMKTVSLASRIDFQTDYDFSKTYVQGRPCDREFSRTRQ